jgi:hypothetical protein
MQQLGVSLNAVHLHDVFEDDVNVHMVMELCEGGALLERVESGRYSERYISFLVRSILRFIAQCHAKVRQAFSVVCLLPLQRVMHLSHVLGGILRCSHAATRFSSVCALGGMLAAGPVHTTAVTLSQTTSRHAVVHCSAAPTLLPCCCNAPDVLQGIIHCIPMLLCLGCTSPSLHTSVLSLYPSFCAFPAGHHSSRREARPLSCMPACHPFMAALLQCTHQQFVKCRCCLAVVVLRTSAGHHLP